MGITGRYDFTGIQKAARVAIDAILATTTWGIWLMKSAFGPAVGVIEDLAVNWLANRGLIIIDVTAVLVNGKVNEARLTTALNDAFNKLKVGRENITPAQGAKIDAETDAAFDNFADVPVNPGSVPNVSNTPI